MDITIITISTITTSTGPPRLDNSITISKVINNITIKSAFIHKEGVDKSEVGVEYQSN